MREVARDWRKLLSLLLVIALLLQVSPVQAFADQQGNRVAMADSNNHVYYYLYNLQGDVIALADAATGKLAATYTYDAWGKYTVKNATGFTIGTENPFRYRGYYYDSETGLYYLQSRYYDAETGRFINADVFTTTDVNGVLSTNMFAYCENNPVMRHDPLGEWAQILIGAAVGIGIQFMEDIAYACVTGQAIDECISSAGTYVSAALSGAFSTVTGCGALARGVQDVISVSVGSYVDAVLDAIKSNTIEKDPNERIIRNTVKTQATKHGESKLSDLSAKLLSSGSKRKKALGVALSVTGKFFGNVVSIFERTAKYIGKSER